MDNLTHSLAGALLGQLGLKRLTGRAMATLVIAANLPDIDALYRFAGPGIGFRRGITHGPVALLVLPLLLAALVLAFDRLWPKRGGPQVRPWAVLLLAFIGTLSHPLLDWLNSYGIRFLEPFSSRWFYGDTLFIIDVWLWVALLASVHLSQMRERKAHAGWRRPALVGLGAIFAYVAANVLLSTVAERRTEERLIVERKVQPTMVVANPVPLTPWRRHMLWRDEARHGSGSYALGAGVRLDPGAIANGVDNPALARAAARDEEVRAYLFWSRMPIVVREGGRTFLGDQRFVGRRTRGYFLIPLDSAGPAP
ncbi:MAG TPA: metal-dependent hydrolase [Sphingomicrobium sp.]|nr:metal-dependent hydrolase [Sphingomicrobium sp.]